MKEEYVIRYKCFLFCSAYFHKFAAALPLSAVAFFVNLLITVAIPIFNRPVFRGGIFYVLEKIMKGGFKMQDEGFMLLAIEEAKKGAGNVAPNPLVGAVIVKNGQVLGKGYHKKFGGPHAEIEALTGCADKKEEIVGATMYVTLEPCNHFGKTPPCTSAIIKSGISRVVVGNVDPNGLVAGNGLATLKEHGITVESGMLEHECRKLNEIYFHCHEQNTPFVLMKYAMSADGKIATKTGSSKWITSEMSRQHSHNTRSHLTAIMVGIGTVEADNPILSSHGVGKDPQIIVCDSRLRISPETNIVKNAKSRATYIATLSQDEDKIAQLQAAGVTVLSAKEKDHHIDLAALMEQLYGIGIDSVLLEGGGKLNYSALSSGIVQRLHLYIGGKLIGGADALSPIEGIGIDNVAQASSLSLETVLPIGDDIFLDYVMRR